MSFCNHFFFHNFLFLFLFKFHFYLVIVIVIVSRQKFYQILFSNFFYLLSLIKLTIRHRLLQICFTSLNFFLRRLSCFILLQRRRRSCVIHRRFGFRYSWTIFSLWFLVFVFFCGFCFAVAVAVVIISTFLIQTLLLLIRRRHI